MDSEESLENPASDSPEWIGVSEFLKNNEKHEVSQIDMKASS